MTFQANLVSINAKVKFSIAAAPGKTIQHTGQVVGWGEIGPGTDVIHIIDVEEDKLGVQRFELPFSELTEAA